MKVYQLILMIVFISSATFVFLDSITQPEPEQYAPPPSDCTSIEAYGVLSEEQGIAAKGWQDHHKQYRIFKCGPGYYVSPQGEYK